MSNGCPFDLFGAFFNNIKFYKANTSGLIGLIAMFRMAKHKFSKAALHLRRSLAKDGIASAVVSQSTGRAKARRKMMLR